MCHSTSLFCNEVDFQEQIIPDYLGPRPVGIKVHRTNMWLMIPIILDVFLKISSVKNTIHFINLVDSKDRKYVHVDDYLTVITVTVCVFSMTLGGVSNVSFLTLLFNWPNKSGSVI